METNCNCKKSGCTKNYCRCYDQKKLCGPSCGCINCQNRSASTSRSSLATATATAVSSDSSTNPAPSPSKRKRFFDEGEFDRCANSLMSVARTCIEQKIDKDVAHRRLLETFSGQLERIQRIVNEKKNQ